MSEIIGEGEIGRFFETAAAVRSEPPGDDWRIELDGRVVKTPMGKPLVVPSSALADGIAGEWNAQGEKIILPSMPLAGLTNAAIDKIAPNRHHFTAQLVGYARSDLLCYWAEGPDDLVLRQRDAWQPVLDWAHETLGAHFATTAGVIPVEQPQETLDTITGHLTDISDFHLAGLMDLAGRMNSVLLALAVWKEHLGALDAFEAAYLDDVFQEEQWGEDNDAVHRRSIIRDEILSTSEFLTLLACE